MTYSSIVPSEMTNHELQAICGDLQTAKNWKLKTATVKLSHGNDYKVDVEDLQDYQEAFQTECGGTLV
jgi:hypothetical protein